MLRQYKIGATHKIIDATSIICHFLDMENEIRERFRRVVRSQRQWANATGQSYEHVSRVMTGMYEVPSWWVPVIEFLEQTPPAQLPERWK